MKTWIDHFKLLKTSNPLIYICKRKLGLWLATISLVSLLLCSLPVVSAGLINTLQSDVPILADELEQNNIRKIALVTHAWHMPRAKYAFEYFDVQVIPPPTAFYGRHLTDSINKFLPSANALKISGLAFHEIFGHWWYKIRYY